MMKFNWPTTVEELVDECEKLKSRYDLYTLGEKGEPFQGESETRVDGTRYLAGEYQYGVAMIPAQWVTHVLSAPDAATVGVVTCEWCKDGKSFDGQRVMMTNHGWERIRHCPQCGKRIGEATE